MDTTIAQIMEAVAKGGPGTLAVVGWGLFLMERYHIGVKRERQYREDLDKFRAEYRMLSDKATETIARFTAILEVVKDRVVR